MHAPGRLFLLPVPISDEAGNRYLPDYNFTVIRGLRYFIAEDARTARRSLKWFGYPDISQAEVQLLNEHSESGDHAGLLTPLLEGHDVGLMSDAGCPGIADPGAELLHLAHQRGIAVVPLAGPSAIVLSIMASGFNGQNFAFNGYLPVDRAQRSKRLKELEQLAVRQGQAQFFIETPYRNEQLFETMLSSLLPQTLLFVGIHIASPDQLLRSQQVALWAKSPRPAMHKVPAVFGIYAHR